MHLFYVSLYEILAFIVKTHTIRKKAYIFHATKDAVIFKVTFFLLSHFYTCYNSWLKILHVDRLGKDYICNSEDIFMDRFHLLYKYLLAVANSESFLFV